MTEKRVSTEEKKNIVRKSDAEPHNQAFNYSSCQETALTTFQQQLGNRETQRFVAQSRLNEDGTESHVVKLGKNQDLIFRKPKEQTQVTQIDLPPMDRIEDAYEGGNLNKAQWQSCLQNARN